MENFAKSLWAPGASWDLPPSWKSTSATPSRCSPGKPLVVARSSALRSRFWNSAPTSHWIPDMLVGLGRSCLPLPRCNGCHTFWCWPNSASPWVSSFLRLGSDRTSKCAWAWTTLAPWLVGIACTAMKSETMTRRANLEWWMSNPQHLWTTRRKLSRKQWRRYISLWRQYLKTAVAWAVIWISVLDSLWW